MEYYRVVLVVHIIAIISWMAGILYLYRLFINHAERGRKSQEVHDLLTLMESRLYRYITRPAMIVSTLAGLLMLALNPALFASGWLHVKLFAVVALIFATVYAGRLLRVFAKIDNSVPSPRHLRILNEVPTILMIVIVSMVILRPF